jgi:hypothetical protein
VQEVPAGVGDANVDALDFGFRLLPVVGELLFAAHSLLRFAQIGRVPLIDVEGWNNRSIREGGETNHAHVDADGITKGNGFLYFKLRLNRGVPLGALAGDGDVPRYAAHRAAIAIPNPSNLGEVYPVVSLFNLEALREAEGVRTLSFLLPLRAVRPLLEEGLETLVEVFQLLLKDLAMRFAHKGELHLPVGEELAVLGVAQILRQIQREILRLAGYAREASEGTALRAVRH